tara:strand:+ start:1096 stop:1467 length:372 start_codon:yes stop_codon:yes gene_type:complete
MLFDIHIANWPNNKREPILFKLFDNNYEESAYALSLLRNLVNQQKGLWRDKEVKAIDVDYFTVKVNKSDIIYFINQVNLKRNISDHYKNYLKNQETKGIYSLDKKNVMKLADDKFYAITGFES